MKLLFIVAIFALALVWCIGEKNPTKQEVKAHDSLMSSWGASKDCATEYFEKYAVTTCPWTDPSNKQGGK